MSERAPLPRAEAWTAAAILGASAALRILYGLRQSFDTDEGQHLHVAILWGRGLVGYRDFFDNHAPLFHVIAAPFVTAAGETPDVLLWARHAMLPIVALLLYALYRLGSSLFSARAALWAVAALSILPSFLYDSVEFRPDTLWAALWIAALAVWAAGPTTTRRGFVLGLLVGAAFVTSVKTIVLVPTFAAAWAIVAGFERTPPPKDAPRIVAAFAAGAIAVVGAVGITLQALGALPEALDCVLFHNFSSIVLWGERLPRIAMFVVTAPLLAVAARGLLRRDPGSGARATFLVATGLYYTTLNGFVPVVPTQSFLPFYPMAVLLTCGLGLAAFDAKPDWRPRGAALLAMVAALEVVVLVLASPPFVDKTRFKRGLVADVLRLTGPDDTVMDLKGENLFRRRPVHAVLERITEERIKRGELADDIAEKMIAARTFVAVVDSPRFPPDARRFLDENYVPVGHLRVAGKLLAVDRDGTSRFAVVVPGRYAILAADGPVSGMLDGVDFDGSKQLEGGAHRFRASERRGALALVWADAAEKGFSPFHPNAPGEP